MSQTPFGAYLKSKSISFTDAAEIFSVTKTYISMLASGAATPSLSLAWKIELWTEEVVPMQAWMKKPKKKVEKTAEVAK